MSSCINKPTDLLHKFIYIIIAIGVLVGFAGNYIQSTSLDNNNNGNSTSFVGNIISVVGLLVLIPLIIAFTRCNTMTTKTTSNAFYDFIVHPGPAIVTIIILSYNTILNLKYKNILINHNVAPEYYRYSLLFSILLILQLIFLVKYIYEYINPIVGGAENINQYIVYLLGTLNLFLLTIMQIILTFFSTDG